MTTKGKTQTGILSLFENRQMLLQEEGDSKAILKFGTDERRVQFGGCQPRERSRSKTKRLEERTHSSDTSSGVLFHEKTSIQTTFIADGQTQIVEAISNGDGSTI
jgi:hypothetical protein